MGMRVFGGLIGYNSAYNKNTTNCYANTKVTLSKDSQIRGVRIGGLIGYNGTGATNKCYAKVDFKLNSNKSNAAVCTGGLIGCSCDAVEECYAIGTIDSEWGAGGLIGYLRGGNVSNVYANVDITGGYYYYVGNLVGSAEKSTITNAYAIGKVDATMTEYKQTFICNSGYLTSTNKPTVVSSYWTPSLRGASLNDQEASYIYGEERTIDELKQKSNYTDWDFSNVWKIDEGSTLPYLLNNKEDEIKLTSIQAKTLTKLTEGENENQLASVPTDYIGIYDAADLDSINNDRSGKYILMNDIDMTGVDYTPIGTDEDTCFKGIFNGNHHKISNLTISPEYKDAYALWSSSNGKLFQQIGLFGCVSGAKIINLNLENVNIKRTNTGVNRMPNIGTVVGESFGGCILKGIRVDGNNKIELEPNDYYSYTGGIIGNVFRGAIIENSYCKIDIIDNSEQNSGDIGGFVGDSDMLYVANSSSNINIIMPNNENVTDETAHILNYGGILGDGKTVLTGCNSNIKIVTNNNCIKGAIGGLVGNSGGTIENSFAKLDVDAYKMVDNAYIGGLSGENRATIEKSYAEVNIKINDIGSKTSIGGLVGYARYQKAIEESFATGNINIENNNENSENNYFGGLAGRWSGTLSSVMNVTNTYADVNITGGNFNAVGGLIGYIEYGYCRLTNTYAVGEINVNSALKKGGITGEFESSPNDNYFDNGYSYWSPELTGIKESESTAPRLKAYNKDGGIDILTIPELVHQDSYQNWDFENVWGIDEGTSLPYLLRAGSNKITLEDVQERVSDKLLSENDKVIVKNYLENSETPVVGSEIILCNNSGNVIKNLSNQEVKLTTSNEGQVDLASMYPIVKGVEYHFKQTTIPETYDKYLLNSNIYTFVANDDASITFDEEVSDGIIYNEGKTYTVTFNTNEGTINEGNVENYHYGTGVSLPTNVSKENYVFKGWYDNENFEGNVVTEITAEDYGDKTYYAFWKEDANGNGIADDEEICTVIFKNGEQTVKTETVERGKSATAPELTKAGYTLSWDKDFTNVTEDMEVNAVWTVRTDTPYKIEYYLRNKDEEVEVYDLVAAETVNKTGTTDTEIAIIAEDIKDIDGFTYEETNSNNVLSGTIAGEGTTVLKLYYLRNHYTITYELDGGEGENLSNSYMYGKEFVLSRAITKEGYTFEGWYDNPEYAGEEIKKIAEGEIGEKTFYAKWTTEDQIKPGDLNGDGNVSLLDLSLINQAIVGKITLNNIQKKAADINKDGHVTLIDLSLINQAIVGKINL